MNTVLSIFVALIGLAFLFYGYNCLFSNKLVEEFDRFKLTASQRKITGIAQIIGALGLLGGLFYYPLGIAAAIGLSILILLGFAVRLKIKDSFYASAPSFILMLVNMYFAYCFGLLMNLWLPL